MTDFRIFSYLPNPRLFKATIAARFSNVEIEIVGDQPQALVNWLWDFDARALSNSDKQELKQFARQGVVGFKGTSLYKSDAFLKAHPFGNVPAGFSGDGAVGIFESNSIMRAVARIGQNADELIGRTPMEQSRIDSFLDRSLVFARDLQRYLLAQENMTEQLHSEMAGEVKSFAAGLDRALQTSTYIAGDTITLADIATICDLCQLTDESNHAMHFEELGLAFLVPSLKPFEYLGAHIKKLAVDKRFSTDLEPYFEKLLMTY